MTFKVITRATDDMVCEVETTGYLEVEGGDDNSTLSPPMKVRFWTDIPKPNTERMVDIMSVHVFGLPVFSHLSANDVRSLEDWCRSVADYQLRDERENRRYWARESRLSDADEKLIDEALERHFSVPANPER